MVYIARVDTAVVDIAAAAAEAYARMCEVMRVPEWVPGVEQIEVLSTAGLRVDRMRCVYAPAGKISYLLFYTYDDASLTVQWRTEQVGERRLNGQAVISELTADRSRLRYSLSTWNAASLPSWSRNVLSADTAQRAANAFRDWVESQR